MAEIEDLSTTDASNTGRWPENMQLSAVNDAGRADEGLLARWFEDISAVNISSGTDTITLSASRTISAYAQGHVFVFEAGGTNTGAATLNVDSVGAKAIKKRYNADLAAGDIVAGQIVMVAYEATADNFQLLSPVAVAPGDLTDPLTTRGDLIVRGASATTRLAVGAADTGLVSDGTDPGWTGIRKQGLETIWIPATAMRATASNGCGSLTTTETTAGRPDIVGLPFDASSDEHAQFSVAMPKSWNEGTVTAQFYWTHNGGQTGGLDGVAFAIQGVAVSDDDTLDVAYGTAIAMSAKDGATAEDLYASAVTSAVTIAGTPAAGDLCYFRVLRDVSDAGDDLDVDAILIGVKLYFTTNAGDDT